MAAAVTLAALALALASSALSAPPADLGGACPAVGGCPRELEDAEMLMQVQVNVDKKPAVHERTLHAKTKDPIDQSQCASAFDSSTYKSFCSADNVSFSQGYCAFQMSVAPTSCNAFCFSNGKRTCLAGAQLDTDVDGECTWKTGDEGAGTASFCDKVISSNLCVCSEDTIDTAPEESECAKTFSNSTGFKGICDESVMTFAGGNCPVLVQTSTVSGGNCDAYCQEQGLTCFAAAKAQKRCSGFSAGGDAAYCSKGVNRQICACDQGAATPAPPSPPGAWCTKVWNSREFSKCDYWGDPHFKKSFSGNGKYDVMGLGAFLAAGTKSDLFEVQNFQCPWGKKVTNTLSVGIAAKFGSDVVVIGDDAGNTSKVWINGVDRSLDYESALIGLGLSVSGDLTDTRKVKDGGGLQILSSDCKHRWLVYKKIGQVNPFFSYGSMIRVPEDDQLEAGMCSGCEYQQHLGKNDILFTAEQIASFCNSCVDPKPDLCTTPVPVSPTPVPVDDQCDDPEDPCEDEDNSPGCGRPAAEAACAKLEGTGCYEGCIFDYCAGDCKETGEEDECEEPPPEPPVEPNTTTSVDPTTTTDYTRPPAITGDPHVTNVEGHRFNLARAGVHELLRLPRGQASRPGHGASAAAGGDVLLRVLGTVASEQACAEPFVRQLDVSGLWLRKTGPLVLRAGGRDTAGEDAVVVEVNGSRVGRGGLAHDETLRGLLRVSEPETAGRARVRHGRIRRDKFLTAELRLPGATLNVDWIHREVPGSSLNHLDLHVASLPKLSEGMDVGGILGRDDHTLASSPAPGCRPSQSLFSIDKGIAVLTSRLGAAYKYE